MYDPKKESSYITYVDANNLYGYAMSEALPYKDIKFNNDINLETILRTPDDADTGYMVEVDSEFPEELRGKLKHFPPCPENFKPKEEWMSEYPREVMKQ